MSESINTSFEINWESYLIMTTLTCCGHDTHMYVAIAMPNGNLN